MFKPDISSGHGTQVGDRAIDEPDKKDEGGSRGLDSSRWLTVAICPLDFKDAGMFPDDESEIFGLKR